ncbi:MAG: M50 family metallopeptidase [Candidatus Altiarchaeota archaeon]
MNQMLAALVVFFVGTVYLLRKGYQRFFIVFLVRTEYGLNLIDRIAKISPRFWKFVADFSVVLSFSGLGGAYLSKNDSRKNLYLSLLVFGGVSAIMLNQGVVIIIAALALLIAVLGGGYKQDDQRLDFLITVLVIYSLASQILESKLIALLESLVGLPVILVYALAYNAFNIVLKNSDMPGISPLLPTSKDGRIGVTFPGYDIFVPGGYALIAIIVTLVSHELAHGILARVHKMKVKSTGLLTFGVLPIGAFVEPDDKEVESRPSIERMRLYAVGSFANFAVGALALIVVLATMALTSAYLLEDGVRIIGLDSGYPAERILVEGDVISGINNISTPTLEAFKSTMGQSQVGDTIKVSTGRGEYDIKTVTSPNDNSTAYIGVVMMQQLVWKGDPHHRFQSTIPAIFVILAAMSWITFFNVNIGLVNLLPISPFDGGRMLKEAIMALNVSEVSIKRLAYTILALTLLIFVINLYPLVSMLYGWASNL